MSDDEIEHEPDFEHELDALARSYKEWDEASTRVITNNELFDGHLLRASRYDTRKLIEKTPQGIVPDAGIPWYAVPFGRDAIITSLQTLIYNPSIAEGTLRFLAAHQGNEVDAYREEELLEPSCEPWRRRNEDFKLPQPNAQSNYFPIATTCSRVR